LSDTARRSSSGKTGKKLENRLVALSSAAVLTIYAAGYARTRSAADRFAADDRRAAAPVAVHPVLTPAPAPDADGHVTVARSRGDDHGPQSQHRADAGGHRRPVAPTHGLDVPRVDDHDHGAPAPIVTVAEPTPAPALVPPVPSAEPTIAPETKRVEPPPPPALPALKDGSYSGWGTSRHGDIQATVVIEGGRIVSAAITQCLTRYPCSWIAQLPGQVVSRQSPECDFVSGATQSTNAFYYAVVEALAKAK
jgi:uncharacterized protein with FMN-binding domain